MLLRYNNQPDGIASGSGVIAMSLMLPRLVAA
jgi:hypothetical protein